MGQVIGVGIFLTPAGMAASLGSPFWLLMVWLVMGAMALSGAVVFGELASRYPEAGGSYVYLRRAYGPGVAFLYGWKCLLVMDPGLTAALAVGLSSYAGYLIPLSAFARVAVAIGVVVVLALVNIRGVRLGARIIGGLTGLKLAALGAIVLLGLLRRVGDAGHFAPFVAQQPGSDPLPLALAAGLVGAFFAFGGWWEISKLAGEARDPARTVPRALLRGVIIVTVAYIAVSGMFLYLVPPGQITSGEAFAAQAGAVLFGSAGSRAFAGIVVVSVLGALAVQLMALPRVYYAMARDRLFFPAMGAIHPRFGTPARAIALQTTLASVLIVVGSFEQILAYFIFVTVGFLGLTALSVVVFRRRGGPSPPTPAPYYPVPLVVFVVLVVVLLGLIGGRNPVQALLGMVVVATGVPVYHFGFRRSVA